MESCSTQLGKTKVHGKHPTSCSEGNGEQVHNPASEMERRFLEKTEKVARREGPLSLPLPPLPRLPRNGDTCSIPFILICHTQCICIFAVTEFNLLWFVLSR